MDLKYDKSGEYRTGYHGLVYVPVDALEPDNGFWKLPLAKILNSKDFSRMAYDIIGKR